MGNSDVIFKGNVRIMKANKGKEKPRKVKACECGFPWCRWSKASQKVKKSTPEKLQKEWWAYVRHNHPRRENLVKTLRTPASNRKEQIYKYHVSHFGPASFQWKIWFSSGAQNRTPHWILNPDTIEAKTTLQKPPPRGYNAVWNGKKWEKKLQEITPLMRKRALGAILSDSTSITPTNNETNNETLTTTTGVVDTATSSDIKKTKYDDSHNGFYILLEKARAAASNLPELSSILDEMLFEYNKTHLPNRICDSCKSKID